MNRQDIFEMIVRERTYQDTEWPRDEETALMYQFSAPHILLLEEYVSALRAMWKNSREEKDCVRMIAKIATIAVRALEEVERPDVNLLETGLR